MNVYPVQTFLRSDIQGENLKNRVYGKNEETFGISRGRRHTGVKVSVRQGGWFGFET